MTPEEIRQIIIADSGLSRGGPAVTRFCKKYRVEKSCIDKHLMGINPPSKLAIAFYSLVSKKNDL